MQPTQSDVVLQFHPWWEQARRRLLKGSLPLASEEIGGCLPLMANGQTGLWAPLMLPVWVLGPERGTTVMALWKLEAAALGAFLFLWRGWRLQWPAAAVGGLAFGCSAYLVAWLLVPLSWVAAALPWAWWSMLGVLRRRAGVGLVLALGGVLGWLMGCGLHPETAAIVAGSALLGGLVLHPRRWTRVALVLISAVPVALAFSWPTLGYIAASARVQLQTDQHSNRQPLPIEVRLAAAQQMVVPAVHGHPARGDWRQPYPHAAGAIGIGGAALAVLAAGAVRRRHRRLLWAALACLAVALVLAFRVPPLDWLLVRIPPFDRMTLPRFALLVPWALAILTALSAEGLLHGARRALPWRLVPAFAMLCVVVSAAPWRLAPVDVVLVTLSIVLAVAAVWWCGRRLWLVAVVAAELAVLAVGVNPVASAADRLPRPPIVEQLLRHQTLEGGRAMGIGGVLPANLASRYGIRDLRAYNPLRPFPFTRLMALLGEPEPILGGALRRAPAGLCGAWSVRHLVTPAGGARAPGWERLWTGSGGSVWRNPRWLPELRLAGTSEEISEGQGWDRLLADDLDFAGTVVLPAGSPMARAEAAMLLDSVVEESRVRAGVRCDGPCALVLARAWAPGWRATIDGEAAQLLRTNLAGLGVMVPAGEHQVELRYNPWRW